MMQLLDLFSGIGGFSLGLERAGMKTVAFCEIDPYCRKVLRKHWPEVPIHEDITRLDGAEYRGRVDVVCGGFPCQDISLAGSGAGLDGDRSGLWREMRRVIGEVRPRYAIVENVAALLSRGLGDVLGDLAALGYDAEWHCIPASAVGAPHRRDRVWIVAYAHGEGEPQSRGPEPHIRGRAGDSRREVTLADADGAGLEIGQSLRAHFGKELAAAKRSSWWFAQPDVGRVADGVSSRVDRLRALGNAVVPQIPEIIGRAIMTA